MQHQSSLSNPAKPPVTTNKRRWTLREQIGIWLLTVTIVPLLVLAWLFPGLETRNLRSVQRERMVATAETTAGALDQFLIIHRAAVEFLADQLAAEAPSSDDSSDELAALRFRYPGFFSLLRTNSTGRVTAVSVGGPEGKMLEVSTLGAMVDSRSYFAKARESGKGFVSEAFRGRLGSEVIVALSAPISDPDGGFHGVVQGVLRLGAFASITSRLGLESDDMSLDIYDQDQRLVYSIGSAPLPQLQAMPEAAVRAVLKERASPGADLVATGEPRLAVAPVGDTGWQVLVRTPGNKLAQSIGRVYTATVLVFALSLMLVWLAISWVAATVARPLESIKRDLDDLDLDSPGSHRQSGARSETPSELNKLPTSASIEVLAIREGFVDLLTRLDRANAAWRDALGAKDVVNHSLARVLAERDAHIEQQTGELKSALHIAHAASVAKDRLLANTSHEIRTPLNGIIGTAELMLHGELDAIQKQRLSTVLRSAESLQSLLNDLLDFARADQGEIKLKNEAFALRSELNAIVETLAAVACSRSLELRCTVDATVPEWVEGDPLRLRQVLLNLIGNALKFTEVGGVTVEVVSFAEDLVRFTVIDTGIGISKVDLDAVFEPFVQVEGEANRRFQGTGLGLPITRHLLALMGSTIHVESTLGVGSRFWFDLPLPARAPAAVAALNEETLSTIRQGEKPLVLVVDDVDVNRELALAQLEMLGLSARTAASGPEALSMLATDAYALVLLDCQMPGMDGFETAARIRSMGLVPLPRIVALTANAQASERVRSLEAGMVAHLTKPLRLRQLRELLIQLELLQSATA